jgi:hypothetical protein
MSKETFTFHNYAHRLKIGKYKSGKIGYEIASTYQLVYQKPADKVERGPYMVNQYPAEFKLIVNNILRSHNITPED